ncbi:MAG: DUF4388 domain-containing protein [Verrucomicrobiota bacterium]
MASILILEDQQMLLAQLTQAMRADFSEYTILPARTVEEAQVLISEYTVPMYIVDVFLEDGTGIDFISDVKTTQPAATIVLMTDGDLAEYQEQIDALDILKIIEKPINPISIAKLLRRAHDSQMESTQPDAQFQASLSNLSSVDIIQLKCLSRATQVLQFTSKEGESGRLYIQKGEIIHAEAAERQGMDAFQVIVSWSGGKVQEVAEPIKAERTLNADWQSLLLETVHKIDENQAVTA